MGLRSSMYEWMTTFKRYALTELLPIIVTITIVVIILVVRHKMVRHTQGVDTLFMHMATIHTSKLPPT